MKDHSCQRDKTIIIKEKNKTSQVKVSEITHITCDSYISDINLLENKNTINVSKLLKNFEEELSGVGFFRANRNTLINIKNVDNLQTRKNKCCIILVNKTEIEISNRKLSMLKKILDE